MLIAAESFPFERYLVQQAGRDSWKQRLQNGSSGRAAAVVGSGTAAGAVAAGE
jgi:hypothetical protein